MSPLEIMEIADEVEHMGPLSTYLKRNGLNIELLKAPVELPELRSNTNPPSLSKLHEPYGILKDV